MADDLAEDWWVEESTETKENNIKENEKVSKATNVVKKSKQDKSDTKDQSPKTGKSRKRQREPIKETDDEKKKPKLAKKKKKKESDVKRERKRISDEPDEVLSKPGSAEDVHSAMTKALKERLGEQALEDLLPDAENDFFPHNMDSLGPSDYLKAVLSPIWRSTLKKSLYMKTLGSPSVLIISSSAIRSVELNRQIKEFCDGKCKVAKLFAKHMKVEEQKKYLSKTNCQFGIGTPGRISLLIKNGSLHLEHLVGVVLDWNWRDTKLKRMADIPELRKDLVGLLKDHLLEVVQGSSCKLALM